MKKILRSIVAMSLALALVGCSGAGGAAKTSGTASKGAESAKTDLPVLRVARMPFITSLLMGCRRNGRSCSNRCSKL